MDGSSKSKRCLGWREWVVLPDLAIGGVKAKVDTGARTSALHAFFLEPFEEEGRQKIRFRLHPLQGRVDIEQTCVADVADRRLVTDSGGHQEMRYVIRTRIVVGGSEIEAEITLTDRDTMQFRMLLGRTVLAERFLVDPGQSYLAGPKPAGIHDLKRKRRAK